MDGGEELQAGEDERGNVEVMEANLPTNHVGARVCEVFRKKIVKTGWEGGSHGG